MDRLSPQQQQALASLKEEVNGDDYTLLRFLRARQYRVKEAAELYRNYLAYRKESGVERLLRTKLPKEELFATFVPHSYHGFDREGRPIYFEKTGSIDYPTVYKYFSNDELMLHHTYSMEKQCERCKEVTERSGKNVDQFCYVVDLENLNLGHKKALKLMKLWAVHDQNFYPERLGKILIINAPWLFPVFWKVCKGWVDENTRNKLVVLGSDYKKELLKYIPEEHIPREYGGKCTTCEGKECCVPVKDLTELKANVSPEAKLDKVATVSKNVSRRDAFELQVPLGQNGGVVEWAFKTASKDIEFSVVAYPSAEDAANGAENSKNRMFVVDPERVTGHRGIYSGKANAVLVLRFDNSYSRFTSKEIIYYVKAVSREEYVNDGMGPLLAADPSNDEIPDLDLRDAPGLPNRSPSVSRLEEAEPVA